VLVVGFIIGVFKKELNITKRNKRYGFCFAKPHKTRNTVSYTGINASGEPQ